MWRPADFVLRGEYCPTADIRDQLKMYRTRYNMNAMMLFTCNTFIGHDPTIVADTTSDSDSIVAEITRRLRDCDDPLQAHIARAVFTDEKGWNKRLRHVANQLEGALTDRHLPPLHLSLCCPAHMHNNQPVRPIALAIATRPGRIEKRHLELLYSMLITHIDVRQAIDSAVLTPLDELLLIPKIDGQGVIDLNEMTARAIEYARSNSRGNVAAIHWRGRPSAASVEGRSDVDDILTSIGDSRSNADLLREMHTIKFAAQYLGTDCAVLACPIPGVLAGPHTPAAGVLLLCRSGQRPYSSHTIALGRAICVRLAVIRATSASGEVARLISEFADLSGTSGSPAGDGPARATVDAEDLPWDVQVALSGMEPALERIAANTNSHSVTIRLVRERITSADPHGLVLERVAATTADETDEARGLVLQQAGVHRGLNWRVALTGRHAYEDDVSAAEDYLLARPATQSELSVPVRAAGQLIGTMNLESASPANYGTFLPYVEAIAGAIGRRFADASLQVGQPVLERAAQVLDGTHTYQKRLLLLREHARTLPLDPKDLARIEEYIQECLDLITTSIRPPLPTHPQEHAEKLGHVVRRAILERPVLDLEIRNDPDSVAALGHRVPPFVGRFVHSATRSILSNMKKHAGAVYSLGAPTVTFDECQWDGLTHAVVVFTNGTDRILPPSIAGQVYRVPIERSGELRLGAHLAGLQLRQIGGWISFDVDPHGLARTVMLVPVNSETKET